MILFAGSSNHPSYSPNEFSSARSTGPVGVLTTGDRTFPPPIGLTFAAWIFIEKLPPASSSNILRLFSVQRKWISGNPKRRFVMKIFSIYLDFASNEIVVSLSQTSLEYSSLISFGYSGSLKWMVSHLSGFC